MVTSTVGSMLFFGEQTPVLLLLLGPTSEVSIEFGGELLMQPLTAPDCSCVTIKPYPDGRFTEGQPL